MTKTHTSTNKLIKEASPYLLQHAHNPVDWYPWGEEALSKAKRENKPIFLSIGYAACHWCHVMERESFENEDIAEILNRNFVSVKVDREERPDLDEIYMAAVVALSGSGGWPMTVFLTPDLNPFFGGTYFPPEDWGGRVGFKRLLLRISEFWNDEQNREKLIQDAGQVSQIIAQRTFSFLPVDTGEELNKNLLSNAAKELEGSFDDKWGGFSGAPKFPPSHAISFLLRDHHLTGNKRSLEMAATTLDRMVEGGIYDHLGGGFHRYSVDSMWLVPHFEKMLYDNAQLAEVYLEAYQSTGNKRYARVAREILDYVLTDMTDSTGGFHSSQDADSEGKEGLFYLWKRDELDKRLDPSEARIFSRYYNVKNAGNFSSHEPYHKGHNILHIRQDLGEAAQEFGMTTRDLEEKLSSIRKKLLRVRNQRPHPGRDDKVIASWNALMISSLARGYQVLNESSYLKAAEKSASFLMEKLRTSDGKLLRIYRAGESKYPAYLEDYAYTARSFIDLYEAGFDEKWLFAAQELTDEMIAQFWDEKNAVFFNTSDLHPHLIVRTKTIHDSAVPSPVGVAVESLLRVGKLLDKNTYSHMAEKTLKATRSYMERLPQGHLTLLKNLSFLVYPPKEIAVAGRKDGEDTQRLLRTIHSHFVPHRILSFIDPHRADASQLAETIPLLSGKTTINGHAAVYVCKNFTCQRPATNPEDLSKQLT